MSSCLNLMALMSIGLVKCPECGVPIERVEDYEADIVRIPAIGGSTDTFMRGDEVTLVCDKCGWKEHTFNWRNFVSP